MASKTVLDMLQPSKRLRSSSPTPEQKKRCELNKLLAKSKRNLRLCAEIVANPPFKLSDLLIEETWAEALHQEFQKPYAQTLSTFLQTEFSQASVPIFPHNPSSSTPSTPPPWTISRPPSSAKTPTTAPAKPWASPSPSPTALKSPPAYPTSSKNSTKTSAAPFPPRKSSPWAAQGVLLLNTVLTVRKQQANSHAKKGWEQFTDAAISTISERKSGVVFLLWGNSAQDKARLIDAKKHYVLKAAHPSGLSANRGFFGCKHFSKTNEILERQGLAPIDWQL